VIGEITVPLSDFLTYAFSDVQIVFI